MSTKSTILYGDWPDYHLYYEHMDGKTYLQIRKNGEIIVDHPIEHLKLIDGKIKIEINIQTNVKMPAKVLDYLTKQGYSFE